MKLVLVVPLLVGAIVGGSFNLKPQADLEAVTLLLSIALTLEAIDSSTNV